MKKLFLIIFAFATVLTHSQWISNYSGNNGSDVSFGDAKGKALTTDPNNYSYVTGYVFDPAGYNNIILIKYTAAGEVEWAKSYNGNANQNDEGSDVRVDDSGNIYVVGYAKYEVTGNDAVVLKYSSTGNLLWSNRLYSTETAADDKAIKFSLDNNNNVYVTGYTTRPDGYTDMFVRKINSSGITQWTRTQDGQFHMDSEGLDLAVSPSGNVYVTGYFTSSAANTDIAIVKYESDGELEWVKDINGSGNSDDKAWGIVVDQSDNIYITGYETSTGNNIDCYTAKLNSSGDILWSKLYNGTGNQADKAWGIVVDSDRSIYITGQTTAANSNIDYLTVKYSSSGAVIWNKTYNGTGNQEDVSIGLCLLPNGNNLVIAGKSFNAAGNYDYVSVKYNSSNGTQSQVTTYGLNSNSQDIPTDIKATSNGHVVITGYSVNSTVVNESDSYISTISLDWGSILVSEPEIPGGYLLSQNYPNPFNPNTNIMFQLPVSSEVKLAVYDMQGKEIHVLVNQQLDAGTHTISFSAGNIASGVYFYRLTAGNYSEIRKMTLIK